MNLQKAIKARFINYKATHFDRFPEGRLLKALKGIHNNKRCFIIGNGPSLAIHDLDILLKWKEISFAFNRIYNINSRENSFFLKISVELQFHITRTLKFFKNNIIHSAARFNKCRCQNCKTSALFYITSRTEKLFRLIQCVQIGRASCRERV